jgi:tryptophan-rich sensory protein
MKQLQLTILFLIINFSGLAVGNWLSNNGPMTPWYTNLNQAPWTPEGWVFGVSWTCIMICFSIYLGQLFLQRNSLKLIFIYCAHIVLNVGWNYLFFNQHLIVFGLITLILLILLICYYFFKQGTNHYKYLLVPYMLWLCVATSLNLYILIHN